MNGSGIYAGRRTPALRQALARRSEFYFDADHEAVLELLTDHYGYIVYPSTLREKFGWAPHKGKRVLEEVAEALSLPRGKVDSPHGEFGVYVFGDVVECKTWPVALLELSYPPVTPPSPTPDPVPVPTPAPAPVPAPTRVDPLADAASAVLDGTKVKNLDAARGLVKYAVTELGMTPEEATDALIHLSHEGRGATRENLRQRAAEATTATGGPVPLDENTSDARFERVMTDCDALNRVAEEHPDVKLGCDILRAVAEFRPITATYWQANHWQEGVHGDLDRDPTAQEAFDAVTLAASAGPITVETVARAVRTLRRETVTA